MNDDNGHSVSKGTPSVPGKLIVLDGIDGSGKATQAKLLAARLERSGLSARVIAFPQYGKKSAGLVEEYLSGGYGELDQVDSYQASLFYALDRFDASRQIRDWLKQGQIVIADRYASANMGHQGSKIANPLERKLFFDWLYRLEYEILNIPKPDLNIFLHLDPDLARCLIDGRDKLNQCIHEKDNGHLQRAEKTFLEIARTYPDFIIIECADQAGILPAAKINDLIWQQLKKIFESDDSALDSIIIRSTDYYSLNPGEKTLVQNSLKIPLTIANTSQDILHIAPGQIIAKLAITV
ncbi:MAG: hypothetical protein Q7R92_05560 [bacterium]|nr:hypothetical protein [bacterium]